MKIRIAVLLALILMFAAQTNQLKTKGERRLPSLPTPPREFSSRQELKDYLANLRVYNAFISKPRFGRSLSNSLFLEPRIKYD